MTLTSTTSIPLGQTAISNVLTFTHTINTLAANVSTAVLSFRRNGSGTYTVINTSTSTPGTYTHTITDSALNAQAFNYLYTVTDSAGASASATKDITPTYTAPTITVTIAGTSTSAPESAFSREKGNVSSNLSATITRNSANVALTSWQWEYSENGSTSYTPIGSATSITGNPSSVTVSGSTHLTATTVASAAYRLRVVDAYQTTLATSATINYFNYIFYGASATAPTTSAEVRALPSKAFTTTLANPFVLITGTQHRHFTVALPSPLTRTNIIDVSALNANLTGQYIISTALTQIVNAASTATAYNVYTMTQAGAYSDTTANPNGHSHQITRA